MPANTTEIRRKRVAVVAVHGVGDHAPSASAREIAQLLAGLNRQEPAAATYSTFTEVEKRVSVRRVMTPRALPGNPNKTWGPMDQIAQAVRTQGVTLSNRDNDIDSIDHLFMKGQLQEYDDEGEPDYPLLREEGKRLLGCDEKTVHVYEMYWADLSRLGNAFTRVFSELYQLLFHLGSVAVNNINAAAVSPSNDPGETRSWFQFARAEWSAVAALAWPIPLFNLLLAALVAATLLLSTLVKLAPAHQLAALVCAGGLAAIGVSLMRLNRRNRPSAIAYAVPIPLTVLVAGILIGVTTSGQFSEPLNKAHDAIEYIWAALLAVAGIAAAYWIVTIYDKRRPGSKEASWVSGGAFAATALAVCATGNSTFRSSDFPAVAALLNAVEVAAMLLALSWITFFICYAWAHFAGWRVVAATPAEKKDKARRTRWTARLVLSLCASIFIFVTIILWTFIVKAGEQVLPGCCEVEGVTASMRYQPISRAAIRALPEIGHLKESLRLVTKLPDSGTIAIRDWAEGQLKLGGYFFMPIAGVLLISVLVLVWAMLPSLIAEISPPVTEPSDGRCGREGRWLDLGFRLLRLPGFLFIWILWTPLALLLMFIAGKAPDTGDTAKALGGIVSGAGIGMLIAGDKLDRIALGIRPAVRAMLDVDSWLREHPLQSNPTARICARYVSLLRHIGAWTDENGRGYDAIVIIAHSQGTVITADLLRFLQAEKKAAGCMKAYDSSIGFLDHIGVYLFTMGCPLQQLYERRFPDLYGYALSLEPVTLGLTSWQNAYRSGDYVGRELQLPGARAGLLGNELIGRGAHTHYWDKTAAEIAQRLDAIIGKI